MWILILMCLLFQFGKVSPFVNRFENNVQLSIRFRRLHSNGNTIGASFGSDALHRPDDEDSPEFREYLKKLLEMQSMRAQPGFSAASSGSTDAYYAKLNRIKLERAARREMGLPEDDVDVDYNPEDYQTVSSEMDTPTVDGLKDLELFGPKAVANLARPLTAGEVRQAQIAELAAKKALAEQGKVSKPSRNRSSKAMSSSDSKMDVEKKPRGKVGPKSSTSSYLEQQRQYGNSSPSSVSSGAPPNLSESQNSVTMAPTKDKKKSKFATDIESIFSPKKLPLQQKLETHELEVVGKALEMTVKHRGGGRFGPGRLPAGEIPKLEQVLNEAYQILLEDSKKAELNTDDEVKNLSGSSVILPPLPEKESHPKISPPASHQKRNRKIDKSIPDMPSLTTDKSTGKVDGASTDEVHNPQDYEIVPITVGVDRFLSNPDSMKIEEIESARDCLIQILAMMQDHIKHRSKSERQSRTPNISSFPVPRPAPIDHVDRYLKVFYEPAVNSSSTIPAPDPDFQLALGLLLKHHGGPGLGRGRLQGKDLLLLERTLRRVAAKIADEAITGVTGVV